MKKIIFGITGLTIGGAERVLVDIVNKLKDKYQITIFTIYPKGAFEKELDKNIKLISLYKKSYEELTKIEKIIIPIKVLFCGKFIYKRFINCKFDIQIAFLEGPITRIFKYGKKIKKIAWIHNDISKVFGNNLKSKIKLYIDKINYKKYDKLVFVSNDNKEKFNNLFGLKYFKNKEEVIYNYIDKKQKAIDRLIRVHKKLIDEKIDHKIYIIGEGPEKEELQELIKKLDVKNSFILIGKKQNPYPYIKKADFFALLSYFEGYPMCIEEAKILNKNIIITNTASKEVVINYSNKVILENTEIGIFNGLKKILQNDIKFNKNEESFANEYLIEKIENILKL